MRGRILFFVLAVAGFGTGACAMSPPAANHCVIVDARKLPSEARDGKAICAKIEAAVAARAPGAPYSATVTVVSKSTLAARLIVGGRALPERKFSVMDRDLNAASISRFVDAIAEEVAKASKS